MKKHKRKPESLEGVLNDTWSMIEKGVRRFNDPFHCPVLGTLVKNGCSQRTVILRSFLLPERMLVCHSDKRSKKVKEIAACPNVSWLFYHPKKKTQIRISGQTTLHTNDEFSDEQWARTSLTSRINYCATDAPGTPAKQPISGLPDFLINKVPTLVQSEMGRKNFVAIATRIETLDWLALNILGNKRARFVWDKSGLNASWVIP